MSENENFVKRKVKEAWKYAVKNPGKVMIVTAFVGIGIPGGGYYFWYVAGQEVVKAVLLKSVDKGGVAAGLVPRIFNSIGRFFRKIGEFTDYVWKGLVSLLKNSNIKAPNCIKVENSVLTPEEHDQAMKEFIERKKKRLQNALRDRGEKASKYNRDTYNLV